MATLINVRVETRSGRLVADVRLAPTATIEVLKEALYDAKDRKGVYSPVRQRLTLPLAPGTKSATALAMGKQLTDYGIKDGSVVQYKDLGIQVSYGFVFFMEYLAPLVVYPFFWSKLGRSMLHGIDPVETPNVAAQDLAFFYWSLHYVKRIYETFHVHKFSHATMPIFNLFKNCTYYGGSAAFVSYWINHPLYTAPPIGWTVAFLMIAYLCQLGNLLSHLILANLRRGKEGGYSIPRGLLFNYVTCANYSFEIWGWLCFSLATQSLPALIFCTLGAGQMSLWAIAKHKRLRKLFDGKDGREKYPRRWVILPPFL